MTLRPLVRNKIHKIMIKYEIELIILIFLKLSILWKLIFNSETKKFENIPNPKNIPDPNINQGKGVSIQADLVNKKKIKQDKIKKFKFGMYEIISLSLFVKIIDDSKKNRPLKMASVNLLTGKRYINIFL